MTRRHWLHVWLRQGTVLGCLAAAACIPAGPKVFALRTADTAPRAPVGPGQVAIVAGHSPDGDYDVVGVVAITAYAGDDPLLLLRTAAASLGADTVTEVRITPSKSATSLSGVALARRQGVGRYSSSPAP